MSPGSSFSHHKPDTPCYQWFPVIVGPAWAVWNFANSVWQGIVIIAVQSCTDHKITFWNLHSSRLCSLELQVLRQLLQNLSEFWFLESFLPFQSTVTKTIVAGHCTFSRLSTSSGPPSSWHAMMDSCAFVPHHVDVGFSFRQSSCPCWAGLQNMPARVCYRYSSWFQWHTWSGSLDKTLLKVF